MQQRSQGFARPMVLLVISVLLLIAAVVLVPRAAGGSEVRRPPRPTVVAAIHRNASETINGRITMTSAAGFTVRVLLGTKEVVELRRTKYEGATSKSLPRSAVRKGDRVIVVGYQATDDVLATVIRDTSRNK